MSNLYHETSLKTLEGIALNSDFYELTKQFGDRFNDAWDIVKHRKIYKLTPASGKLVYWVIEGVNKDYVVLVKSGYCSCDDFYFNIIDGKGIACKHLIATRIAEIAFDYKIVRLDDIQLKRFLRLWRLSINESNIRILNKLTVKEAS